MSAVVFEISLRAFLESVDTHVPVSLPGQALPLSQAQLNTGVSNTSQQIPPIHDIQSMSGSTSCCFIFPLGTVDNAIPGTPSIGNNNLLGAHTGSSGVSQFMGNIGFSGGASSGEVGGQYLPIPRAPSLSDVTSGSHPELLQRSSSISDAGVGIPHQLAQSGGLLPAQAQSSSQSAMQTTGDSSNPVLTEAKNPASNGGSTLPHGNLLPMGMAIPPGQQRPETNMPQGQQQQQQQQQYVLSQKHNAGGANGNVSSSNGAVNPPPGGYLPSAGQAGPPKRGGRWSGEL